MSIVYLAAEASSASYVINDVDADIDLPNFSSRNNKNKLDSIGSVFRDSGEVLAAMRQLQEDSGASLYVRNSLTVGAARKRSQSKQYSDHLKLALLDLACVHGGRVSKPSTQKIPTAGNRSQILGCPFKICVRASTDGTYLHVTDVRSTHQHHCLPPVTKCGQENHYPQKNHCLRDLRVVIASIVKVTIPNAAREDLSYASHTKLSSPLDPETSPKSPKSRHAFYENPNVFKNMGMTVKRRIRRQLTKDGSRWRDGNIIPPIVTQERRRHFTRNKFTSQLN